MDYSARWYSPSVGRFTTQDTWSGDPSTPQTLNRYAYAMNNPLNISDPSGHMPCYNSNDGSLICGYNPNPDNGGTSDSGGGGSFGGDGGNGGTTGSGNPSGGGGSDGGGSNGSGGGTVTPPSTPWWMDLQVRTQNLLDAAGPILQEVGDFSQGYSCSMSKNMFFLPGTGLCGGRNADTTSFLLGKIVGDAYNTYQGVQLALSGGIETVGASVTVVGAVADVLTVAQVAYGGTVAIRSSENFMTDMKDLGAKFQSDSGGGGGDPSPPDPTPDSSANGADEVKKIAGSNKNHINGAIAEHHTYQDALKRGEIGIQKPGNVTEPGPDFITFDKQTGTINVYDSKYSSTGKFPSSVKGFGSQSWIDETQNAINNISDQKLRQQVQKAFDEGNINWKIAPYKWP